MKTLHQFDEVFDTQAVFRLLLEAMANPTRVVSIAAQKEKLFGNNSAFLALGMTLLDNEVTFSTCGEEALQKDLQLVTLSQEAPLPQADYLFLMHKCSQLFWSRQNVAHSSIRIKVQHCSFWTAEKKNVPSHFMGLESTGIPYFIVPVLSKKHWICEINKRMNIPWAWISFLLQLMERYAVFPDWCKGGIPSGICSSFRQ